MKSTIIGKTIIGCIFLLSIISLGNYLNISEMFSEINVEDISDNPNSTVLRTSGFWNLTYIYIDNNWSAAEGEEWCKKENGFYIIENVTIDATNSPTGCGIYINNSKNDYFIIRNCTVYNAEFGDQYAGILLENTHNGTLIDNDCTDSGYYGIKITERCENITVVNNTANENQGGIWVGAYSEDIILSGNTLVNNVDGIIMIWAYDVHLLGNEMWGCGLQLVGAATDTHYTTLSIYTNNTVNGKPLYFYYYKDGLNPENFSNAGQIFLYKCHNSYISNLNVSNTNNGIQLVLCENNTISTVTANDNVFGIYIYYSSHNNTVSSCELSGNAYGIYIRTNSNNNTIYNNSIRYNYYGLNLGASDYNNITGNTIDNNADGIKIEVNSDNNEITENLISNCSRGIYVSDATGIVNNTIYNNCFIDNVLHAKDDSNPNANNWDNGIIGNYWDDYSGTDSGNGIGNIPYNISGSAGAQDEFPLMECPFNPPSNGGGGAPFPLFLIVIISVAGIAGIIVLVYVFKKRK